MNRNLPKIMQRHRRIWLWKSMTSNNKVKRMLKSLFKFKHSNKIRNFRSIKML